MFPSGVTQTPAAPCGVPSGGSGGGCHDTSHCCPPDHTGICTPSAATGPSTAPDANPAAPRPSTWRLGQIPLRIGRRTLIFRLEKLAVGAVAFAFQVVGGHEAEGGGVDAVAQASGFPGAVMEHVAQVAVALRRADLGPGYQHAEVAALDHVAGLDRDGEARPAGVAVEFADRGEQRFAGHDVDVDAGLLVIPVLVPERRLGTVLLSDPVLLRGKPGDGLGIFAAFVSHVSSCFMVPLAAG